MTEISEKEIEAAMSGWHRALNDAPDESVYERRRRCIHAALSAAARVRSKAPISLADAEKAFLDRVWPRLQNGCYRAHNLIPIEIQRLDFNEFVRDGLCAVFEAAASQPSGAVKPLDEDDYEEIISAATINMRKATSGIQGQMVTVQDNLEWWVMKETERRILSALTSSKPEQAVPSGTVEALKRIAQLKEVRRGGGVFDYEPALSAMEMYEIAFDALSALTAGKPKQEDAALNKESQNDE